MRFMKWRLLLLMIGVLLFACEGEEIAPTGVRTAIRLTAEIEGMRTRLSGSTWEKGDAIGVYMKLAGASLDSSAPERNVPYSYNAETGEFEPKDEKGTIYFPFTGDRVDFIGYYPYRDPVNDFTLPIDLSVQSKQSAIDLMYADNVKDVNEEHANVSMVFSHKLSKIVMQVQHYRGIELEDLSVIITSVPVTGSFDLRSGNLSVDPATTDVACSVNKDCTLAEAILMPGTDLSGSELWFVTGDGAEAYKVDLGTLFTTGSLSPSTQYTFVATLFTDEVKVVTDSTGIIPWNSLDVVKITANRTTDSPPVIKGSKSDPYTVAQAINNQEKQDVWAIGYIVGAFDGGINKFVTDTTGQVRTNVALADNRGETDITRMLPVNFTTASLKNALNICDNPLNINRLVMIRGDLDAYYSAPGMRNTTDYLFLE
jgi:hypothetical protein